MPSAGGTTVYDPDQSLAADHPAGGCPPGRSAAGGDGGGPADPGPETLDRMAERCRRELARLPQGCLRFINPHRYKVSISPQLNELRYTLIAGVRTGKTYAMNEKWPPCSWWMCRTTSVPAAPWPVPRWRPGDRAAQPGGGTLCGCRAAGPCQPRLASAADPTFPGVWRPLAGALRPGQPGAALPSGPAAARRRCSLPRGSMSVDGYSAFDGVTRQAELWRNCWRRTASAISASAVWPPITVSAPPFSMPGSVAWRLLC